MSGETSTVKYRQQNSASPLTKTDTRASLQAKNEILKFKRRNTVNEMYRTQYSSTSANTNRNSTNSNSSFNNKLFNNNAFGATSTPNGTYNGNNNRSIKKPNEATNANIFFDLGDNDSNNSNNNSFKSEVSSTTSSVNTNITATNRSNSGNSIKRQQSNKNYGQINKNRQNSKS